MEVTLIHFPLHPETPVQGQSLEDLFAGRDMDINAMYLRMKGLMDAEGLEYGPRTHTYNSRLAQELGKWADLQAANGKDYSAIHDALYRAYFVGGKNIGDVDVLLAVAEKAGLPVEDVRNVVSGRIAQGAVDADWEKSKHYGVTGVPTFVAGGYGLVGAQPYEALEQLMLTLENPIATDKI